MDTKKTYYYNVKGGVTPADHDIKHNVKTSNGAMVMASTTTSQAHALKSATPRLTTTTSKTSAVTTSRA